MKPLTGPVAKLAGYDLLAQMSSGGMGQVLLARRRAAHGFEKLFAVKTIRADLAPDERVRAMFLDEARLVARLNHRAIAQVVEVTVDADGSVSVDRMVCVVDPGSVVHPDTVVAMMEGGMMFGLNAALFGEITVKDGRVEQSNFHDCRELPLANVPAIEVYLLPQGGRPEGIGEIAVPGIAPALANAIFAATGKRIRTLPIGQSIA